MRITSRFKWHARTAGGLFVGLRYSYPVSIYEPANDAADEEAVSYTQVWLSIGLGPCTICLTLDYNFKQPALG